MGENTPQYVTNAGFVMKIDYHYSGRLPAEATIRLYAGKEYAGKKLYYGQLLEGTSITSIQPVVVDANGYIEVKQDHCSSYILTSEEPKTESDSSSQGNSSTSSQTNSNTPPKASTAELSKTGGNASPQTGDQTTFWMYGILAIAAMGILFTVKYKVSKREKEM